MKIYKEENVVFLTDKLILKNKSDEVVILYSNIKETMYNTNFFLTILGAASFPKWLILILNQKINRKKKIIIKIKKDSINNLPKLLRNKIDI